jgi:hypothetical protein
MYPRGGPEMGQEVAEISSMVNEIFRFVVGPAQAMEIGEVERGLLAMVMEVGRQALREFVSEKGTGYQGTAMVDGDGNRLRYERDRGLDYRSIFGTIRIERAYYHRPGSSGRFPLDGELNLPERGYSYLVQEFSSKLAVNTSYENAVEIIEAFFPVSVPIRSLESILADLSDDVIRYYEQKAAPKLSVEAVVTVATVDKKGVVIRKPEEDESDGKKTSCNPDKPGKKKMATVISAYATPRHVRSADDIVQEMSREGDSKPRPKPQHKYTCASLTQSAEQTVAHLQRAVNQRLPQGNELVCILDGERSLWTLVYQYFPTAFFVLDIFHVLEHLAKAALCFHDEGSPEARAFVTERLRMLLMGKAGRVIGGLKQMLTKHDLSGSKGYDLGRVIGYLERNRQHMRYEICLVKGYPIGSGVIEGACRNLINDRLELTGMSWTPTGAESVIRLRAVHINKDWDSFWKYRRKSERRRLYGREDNAVSAEIREKELLRAA